MESMSFCSGLLPFTVAEGGGHPLVDFDLTMIIQLVVFLGVWLVAKRLVFAPYLKLRDRRSEGIDGARRDAERASADADAEMARYETLLENARGRAQEARREIHKQASADQKAITDKARQEAQKTLADAEQKLNRESTEARNALLARSDQIARDMATRLLGREVAS
jgi:F-type H+-transporting ATPase subunit b